MNGKWLLFVFFLLTGSLLVHSKESFVFGSEEETIDYDLIQETLDGLSEEGEGFQFEEYVSKLVRGEQDFSIKGIFSSVLSAIQLEFQDKLSTIGLFLAITIAASIFTNFSISFRNGQTAETGFFVTYLLLYSVLAATFFLSGDLVSSALSKVLDFMKVLIPSYAIAVAFSTGSASSVVLYQGLLIMVTLVDILLIKIILPLIHLYMIVVLANHISQGELLSKTGELIHSIVKWSLKTLIGVVVGFSTIQSLITPAIDQVKRTAVAKLASSIPGIGNVISGVTETVLGAGLLMKNAIGVAGMVVILILCAIPVAKLLLYVLTYKISCAVVQPVSDKRMLGALSTAANASSMLLHTLLVGILVFLLAIAIVAISTRGI